MRSSRFKSAAPGGIPAPGQHKIKASGQPIILKYLKRLAAKITKLLPWRRSRPSLVSLLLPGATKPRSASERKKRRLDLVGQAKRLIAAGKPASAIRLLTRALLEDPQHTRYHELLTDAATLRRVKRNKRNGDPLVDLHRDIKPFALQLDAFGAYVEELEKMLDDAGVPKLPNSAPTLKGKVKKTKKNKDKGGGRSC